MDRLPFRPLTLAADENYPFAITANCYPHPNFQPNAHHTPVTLLVLHSTSFHKEALEPMLADVFTLTSTQTRIREAWIIECPNHGESAVLNHVALCRPEHAQYFSCESYAEAARRLLGANIEGGPGRRLPTDTIVGIGHSLGGCAIVFLENAMRIFTTLVLLDPFLLPMKQPEIAALRKKLISRAASRTDSWPSLQDIHSEMQKRRWEPRVRQLYVAYGIRKSDDGTRYTLACTREQEITMYRDRRGATQPIEYLHDICNQLPVHIAFGTREDVVPKRAQGTLVDRAGCQFASVGRVENAGHLIPQENPAGAARFVAKTLQYNAARL